MSVHQYCQHDCGGTGCNAPVKVTQSDVSLVVVYLSDKGIEYQTIKEAAIDDIREQPFF